MDLGLVISSPNACSLTIGGNHWRSKNSTKNIYYANSCTSKGSTHKSRTKVEYNVERFQGPSLHHHYKCIETGSTYQECNKNYCVKAVLKPSFDYEPHASDSKNISDFVKNFLVAFQKLSYPYAIIGIGLSVISSTLHAVEKLSDISPLFFFGMLQVVVPQTLVSIYTSGLNQLFDFEIDKINKPYLPLASGELSFTTVAIISASFFTMSFGLCWIIGSRPLIWGLALISLLWSAYSINVPMLRWKKHPLLAAMCMVLSSLILPITSFIHMQTFVLKRPLVFPRSLIFAIVFMGIYSVGIALAKDIPDVEGDKTYGIDTFSVRWGQKRVFWICICLFEMAFGVAFLAGATSYHLWIKILTAVGQVVLASILWYRAKLVDLNNKASTLSFYIFTWKLWYSTCFLMSLNR